MKASLNHLVTVNYSISSGSVIHARKTRCLIFEAILILETKASNSTATLVQHVSGGFELAYLT